MASIFYFFLQNYKGDAILMQTWKWISQPGSYCYLFRDPLLGFHDLIVFIWFSTKVNTVCLPTPFQNFGCIRYYITRIVDCHSVHYHTCNSVCIFIALLLLITIIHLLWFRPMMLLHTVRLPWFYILIMSTNLDSI